MLEIWKGVEVATYTDLQNSQNNVVFSYQTVFPFGKRVASQKLKLNKAKAIDSCQGNQSIRADRQTFKLCFVQEIYIVYLSHVYRSFKLAKILI